MFPVFIRTILFLLIVSSCDFGPKPDKVIEMTLELHEKIDSDEQINLILLKLNKRLQKITKNAEVKVLPNKNHIKITIATNFLEDRFKKYILNPGKLDFYETYNSKDLSLFFGQVNEISKINKESEDNPFYDLIKGGGYSGGAVLFYVAEKDTVLVNGLISSKEAESALPVKKRFIKFLWGIKDKDNGNFPLYALKKDRLGAPALSGDVIVDAFPRYNALNMPVISMQMNPEGADKWEDLTGKVFQQRSNIAIVLNDQVYSAPGVSSGPIHEGRSEISGDFTKEEAQDFANILMSGSIPKMKMINVEVKKIE
ncbi:hypothetical protein D1818_08850 [Aquimarina sp. BL5]|uniref:SecDF P1 head subdomain-containing protein n=1 Tax=Aquimarina sp. BL5 TaxID=1714860 RepID=UPI000E522C03|nr:hypothetical protein [Aquimarina sp. BL5]AXT50927.1 hypothetical protein D1818_08850 [Aquimarina sp. BL5]RKM98700.1 hypothetical protein D7036_19840 [Aquimarina sp. BL5]